LPLQAGGYGESRASRPKQAIICRGESARKVEELRAVGQLGELTCSYEGKARKEAANSRKSLREVADPQNHGAAPASDPYLARQTPKQLTWKCNGLATIVSCVPGSRDVL
jgi:hypothetical protein